MLKKSEKGEFPADGNNSDDQSGDWIGVWDISQLRGEDLTALVISGQMNPGGSSGEVDESSRGIPLMSRSPSKRNPEKH